MTENEYDLHVGEAKEAYPTWPTPATIVSDGAYGVGGFHGDPRTPADLADWYRPHVEAWSKYAHPSTTLWFWNTEVGWANVHPVLVENGWEYIQMITWDKGIGHVAGNVNSKSIRRFPVVSEVCAFYQRALEMETPDGPMQAKQWMRHEWKRSGLRFREANEACGVKDAATRKYFAQDWLWYFPPADVMEKLVRYANEHGDADGRPYYSLDGVSPVSRDEWDGLRYKFNLPHGVTNVWSHPPLRNKERLRGTGKRQAPVFTSRRRVSPPPISTRSRWRSCGGFSKLPPSPATLCGSRSAACAPPWWLRLSLVAGGLRQSTTPISPTWPQSVSSR